jgi:hypothetical protein
MSLSAATLGALIDSNLAADGAIGTKRTSFSLAVATGIVNHVVGKTFTTADTGTFLGSPGVGTGTGILGLSAASMKSTALGLLSSQGPKADTFLQAIMNAVVSHLSVSTLFTSTHPSVGVGTAIVTIGSISVNSVGMANSIKTELENDGAIGANLSNLCTSIATGIVTNILASGTGNIVISGIAGIPAAGVGTGVIS